MHKGFLASILEAPDDDVPRLIYADWLDEHGQPERAELIRVQIELAQLPQDDPRRQALEQREDALLRQHEYRWTAPLWNVLPEDVTEAVFHRGFVEEVIFWGQAGAEALAAHADDLFRLVPLQALRLLPLGGHTTSPMPWETQTKTVTDRLRIHHLRELLCSPHLERVRLLDLSGGTLPNPDGGPDVVVSNLVGDYEATLLAEASSLRELKTLLLRDNVISDRGALALAESPNLTGLTTLDLSHNRLSEAMKEELRRRLGERVLLD